ncbi:MAG: carbohydrate ABC transporter permease [Armatimonadetes bacterium]|nr:carbohydrate ABC transporter permease [Armatimonadota bacterium]
MALVVLYAVLCLGAVTTLYPFMLMFATGFTGPTDQNENRLIPEYFSKLGTENTDWSKPLPTLFGKYIDDKYSSDVSLIKSTRIGLHADLSRVAEYEALLMRLPVDSWTVGFKTAPGQVTGRLAMKYQAWLQERFPDIDTLNKAYVEESVAFSTVVPPAELLDRRSWIRPQGQKYQDWLIFKATLPAEYRIPIRATRMWQEFARSKCEGQFALLPAEYKGQAKAFEELAMPESGAWLTEFRDQSLPTRFLAGTVEDYWNQLHPGGPMPIGAYEKHFVEREQAAVKSEFASRNFRYVFNYMALNGRALLNTAIFCILVILTQLTVNPLAAYALSRYPIRASGRILIFLLATMAFPAEVAMIPSFLLLKHFNLLNTFWALVLPGAASGYMIFLLKGFFDSLPQELFESGSIDGAKDLTMLWKIALPLSRPVLGYLALLAFMGAYGAFMFAFLIVQDRSMWTLMVSIYQLQMVAPKAVVMAALSLAAIPTLTVFLLAQRVIMRGIVLPGER